MIGRGGETGPETMHNLGGIRNYTTSEDDFDAWLISSIIGHESDDQ